MVLHFWHSCSGANGYVPPPARSTGHPAPSHHPGTELGCPWAKPPPREAPPFPWGQLGMLSTIQGWLLRAGYWLSQLAD